MPFKNEFVPSPEQENSEFLKKARKTLQTGNTQYDRWTIDRTNESALNHKGSGREIESANHDLWSYLDQKGYYVFSTEKIFSENPTPETIVIKYKLNGFWEGEGYSTPDAASLIEIKNALREYSRWHLFTPEAFSHSQITLVDGRNGQEI